MNNLLFYSAAFTLALAVLIVVHEFGHYLVARLAGVKVLRFSFGFGRVLWTQQFGRDGTEFSIGAFPVGGYVKMLDEREGKVGPEELHRSFNRQSVWRRMAIVAAGPAANLVFGGCLVLAAFLEWDAGTEAHPWQTRHCQSSGGGGYRERRIGPQGFGRSGQDMGRDALVGVG